MLPTIKRKISEMTSAWSTGLRTSFGQVVGSITHRFWPRTIVGVSRVTFEKTRALYRNDAKEVNLGSGFCHPIIDLTVSFLGLPHSSIGDEIVDEFLDKCIHVYWANQIQAFVRDSCRDSSTVVRFRKSKPNSLMVDDEIACGYLEIVPPETCVIFYDPQDAKWISRAIIIHEIEEFDEQADEQLVFRAYKGPRTRIHKIIEEITPDAYRYFDETTGEERDDLNATNPWGFVPLVEVYNEFEAYLGGGQSDLETPYVFIRAFHDVLGQTLQAHKQHSIPKAKFKIQDIEVFLSNNFPDAFEKDTDGRPIAGTFNGKISWEGSEILFFQPEEDATFLEARSVLGDSKTLLEFLVDCICISSETPRWAFGLDVGAADKAETLIFTRKIERKRVNFEPYIQQLCKMVLAANRLAPVRPELEWNAVDPNEIVTMAQALQQETMSLELLQERQLISDDTARGRLRRIITNMKPSEEEARDAKQNVAPISLGGGPNSGNGRVPITGQPVGGRNE
jgi:hypothetical protein